MDRAIRAEECSSGASAADVE
ncbi:MAG: hypothetical protein JWR58_1884, partial [Pseudonocardia sp.]|nr:hypothetical protein [Pseudonocardia sp.]